MYDPRDPRYQEWLLQQQRMIQQYPQQPMLQQYPQQPMMLPYPQPMLLQHPQQQPMIPIAQQFPTPNQSPYLQQVLQKQDTNSRYNNYVGANQQPNQQVTNQQQAPFSQEPVLSGEIKMKELQHSSIYQNFSNDQSKAPSISNDKRLTYFIKPQLSVTSYLTPIDIQLEQDPINNITACMVYTFDYSVHTVNIYPYLTKLFNNIKNFNDLVQAFDNIFSEHTDNEEVTKDLKRYKMSASAYYTYIINRAVRVNLDVTGVCIDDIFTDWKDLLNVYSDVGVVTKLRRTVLQNFLTAISNSYDLSSKIADVKLDDIMAETRDDSKLFLSPIPRLYNLYHVKNTAQELGFDTLLVDTDRFNAIKHPVSDVIMKEVKPELENTMNMTAIEDIVVFGCGHKFRLFENYKGDVITEVM